MKKLFGTIAALLLLVAVAWAEQVSIHGRVTNAEGSGLNDVAVRLAKHPELTDTTDEEGLFSLSGQIASVINKSSSTSVIPVRCTGTVVHFSITHPTHITVDVFNTAGRRLAKSLDKIMQPGSYSLPVSTGYGAQMGVVRIRYEGDVYLFRMQLMRSRGAAEGAFVGQIPGLSKHKTSPIQTSKGIDTLIFTRKGFVTYSHTISSYISGDQLIITMKAVEGPSEELLAKVIAATEEIRKEVQHFRGKDFRRDIDVSVYSRSQYASMVSKSDTTSREMMDFYNRILRFEGLLRPKQDFFETQSEMLSEGIVGYYVSGTDSLYVIVADDATDLSMEDSVCIFHELTHALQDQYFDLNGIMATNYSSDSYYAVIYTIEGEAELLCDYYMFKLYDGTFPSSSVLMIDYLKENQILCDEFLDSLHLEGEPLLAIMPMIWEYYSYGPLFINEVAGMQWSLIDSRIFTALPMRMFEVFHPEKYSGSNEYALNVWSLENAIAVGSNEFIDEDELGELLVRVMFREWDFDSYMDIADGMLADNIIVYQSPSSDSFSMIWNTHWRDTPSAAGFFINYASLVNKKWGILLPDPVNTGTYSFINDTHNKIYIEQSEKYVFSIEKYRESTLETYIAQCRAVQPFTAAALAKAAGGQSSKKPRVSKHRSSPGRPLPPAWD